MADTFATSDTVQKPIYKDGFVVNAQNEGVALSSDCLVTVLG